MAYGPDENLVNHQDLWDFLKLFFPMLIYTQTALFACIGPFSVSLYTLKLKRTMNFVAPVLVSTTTADWQS